MFQYAQRKQRSALHKSLQFMFDLIGGVVDVTDSAFIFLSQMKID
jgi:hypothetical protein